MGKGRYSAQRRADVFGIKSDHSGLVKADGTTAVAAIDDALLTIGNNDGEYIIESVELSNKDDGSVDVKIVTTQYNADVKTFKEKYTPRKASSSGAKPEKFSVSGYKIGGGTSSNPHTFLVVYGGCDGTDIVVGTYVIAWANTSFGKSYKGKEWLTVTLEGSSVAANAAISIAAALFDDKLVDVSTSQTHAKDLYEAEFFLPVSTDIAADWVS